MHAITVAGYLVLVAAIVALTAWPYVRPGTVAPFGALLQEAMEERAMRVTVMVFWWWLGWHFLLGT